MLQYTKVKLELLKDPDMHSMIEAGIRGGVAVIAKRYVRANNPRIPERYDPSLPTSWLLYQDVNNLYGFALMQPLPYCGFEWLSPEEAQRMVEKHRYNDKDGAILEVDLEYPSELHDLHKDYCGC